MFIIMFVLDNPEKLSEVLDAWEKVGVTGATILESTGLQRLKRTHVPMRFLPGVYEEQENHLTLITLVQDEALITACLQAAESIVGDLDNPDTGISTAWPATHMKGIGSRAGS